MGISIKTRKMLWGKAANRCAYDECKIELVMGENQTDDPSIVGEECHIVARELRGPRGDYDLQSDKRDLYNNLILLCNVHHKLVDDQPNTYSVEKLSEMKNVHEEWVNKSLNIDPISMKNDLIYSTYIDEWAKRANLDIWSNWTSYLLGSGQPSIDKSVMNDLEELKEWMFTRVMPNQYTGLENAWENFRRVLQALINTFFQHSKAYDNGYETEKFYKSNGWSNDYHYLLKEYHFHVDLVMDLTLELTRAANYLCDQVRNYLISDFRLKEGLLVVTAGPNMDLTFTTHRVRYTRNPKNDIPFTTLELFKLDRKNRDVRFGLGRDVSESEKRGIEY